MEESSGRQHGHRQVKHHSGYEHWQVEHSRLMNNILGQSDLFLVCAMHMAVVWSTFPAYVGMFVSSAKSSYTGCFFSLVPPQKFQVQKS